MSFLLLLCTLDCCHAFEEESDELFPAINSAYWNSLFAYWNTLFGYTDPDSFTPFQKYRKLLRSQRLKKSKREIFRPAYGFGKKKRSYGQSQPSLDNYFDDNDSNLYGSQYYRLI